MSRSSTSPAPTATSSPLPLKQASTFTGWWLASCEDNRKLSAKEKVLWSAGGGATWSRLPLPRRRVWKSVLQSPGPSSTQVCMSDQNFRSLHCAKLPFVLKDLNLFSGRIARSSRSAYKAMTSPERRRGTERRGQGGQGPSGEPCRMTGGLSRRRGGGEAERSRGQGGVNGDQLKVTMTGASSSGARPV